MTERRSRAAFERAGPVRRACVEHPFVRGLADGALPSAAFARWIVQDWCYLQVYVQVLQTLADRAPPAAAPRWRALAALTRDEELDLHRALAADFGLRSADLEGATPSVVTTAYSRFLRDAAARSYAVGVAAVCPCGAGYLEIARALAAEPPSPEPRYAAWIASYNAPAFADAVAFMEGELDRADGDDEAIAATYAAGAHHELAFWDALWTGG